MGADRHFSRSHVFNYHKKKRLNMPKILNTTIDDRETNIEETPNYMAEEEHVIDSIVNHDKKGENWTYLNHWDGQDPSDDSWEPLSKLPRKKVVTYHKRRRLSLPEDIDQSINC